MSVLRIAIIGCGRRAADHLDPWNSIPGARLVACCAPSPLRREPLAARYGMRAYADVAEMLEREHPDVVHIVTAPTNRVSLIRLVAAAGTPLCTVEKPICTGVADYLELLSLAGTTRTRFAVCHQFRWHAWVNACREAIAAGELGRIEALELSAGMNLAGQGTHLIDYGLSWLGDPDIAAVDATVNGWSGTDADHPAPDACVARLRFNDGRHASLTLGSSAPRCGDPTTHWQHVRVAAHGEDGMAVWEEFGRWRLRTSKVRDERSFAGMATWHTLNLDAQAGFYRACLAWLQGGPAPGTALERALHQWSAVLAIYTSALERRPVSLSGFNPAPDLLSRLVAALAPLSIH